MVTSVGGGGVEEEEGVVSDPGTELMSDHDEKVKVRHEEMYMTTCFS